MSMTTGTTLGSTHASVDTADAARHGAAKAEGKIAAVTAVTAVTAAAAAAGAALGDAAGTTVTWSEDALDAVENDVSGAVRDVRDAVADTYDTLKSGVRGVVDGVEQAAGATWGWIAHGVGSAVDEAGTLAHEVLVDAPAAVISATGSAVGTVIEGAASVAGDVLGLAALGASGGVKVIGALL